MNKLNKISTAAAALCAAFTISCAPTSADISILSFVLCAAFTAAFAKFFLMEFVRRGARKFAPLSKKMLEYLPFVLLAAFVLRRAGKNGAPLALDALSVLIWCAASVLSIWLLRICKREFAPEKKKMPLPKRILLEILGWGDAIVQAVFMVMLVNIFILQLYEIPSESMVPEFLVRDRVLVFKTAAGPKFPLSQIGIPRIQGYKRGDIVVFRNPHYESDRKSEVKTVVSQLVYMGTLTLVNLNRDEHGNPKADPLVKRVCGVPGEQLVMQDGILYRRTRESPEFQPVEEDASWAEWNLNDVRPDLNKKILQFPVRKAEFDEILRIEEERRNLDVDALVSELDQISAEFDALAKNHPASDKPDTDARNFFSAAQMCDFNMFDNAMDFTKEILRYSQGRQWFRAFLHSARNQEFSNPYDEANFRLNLMLKAEVARLYLRFARLISGGGLNLDSEREEIIGIFNRSQPLRYYVAMLDGRNMPAFPPDNADGSPNYIEEDHYFMMGDNRFNSLDMRHAYEPHIEPLSRHDEYSLMYRSNLEPQTVPADRMLGRAAFRFWPFSRAGVPGHTGK